MAKIFISYRREDSAEICGRIFDRLEAHYGDHAVLKDVDSIPAGADFRAYLAHMVTQCDVMMVVIGPRWFGLDPYHPRLQDPNDFVRSEVELALRRGIPIIPVLVYGVDMPAATSLPPSLAPLSYRNALWVRGDPDFRRDLDRVIAGIDSMIAAKAAAAPGDTTPVDLSPPARAQSGSSTSDSNATTGAPAATWPATPSPQRADGVPPAMTAPPAPPASPAHQAPLVVPNVVAPPPSQPLPPSPAALAGSYPPQPGFGAFAPVTGAPAMPAPAAPGAPGPYVSPPSTPLGGAWSGVHPPVAAATPPTRPPRRALGRVLISVALAILVFAVVITGLATMLAARHNDQVARLAAAATQTATAAHIYTAASPGPTCDHGGAVWRLTNAKDSCLTSGAGTQITQGSDTTAIGTADFYWRGAASLPANARVRVTISQLSAGSCGGVLLRQQAGAAGAYGFWICDDGTAEIVRYDDKTGKPTQLDSTHVSPQASYTLVASAVGTTLTLSLGAVPMSVTDTTYTTSRDISLGIDHSGTKVSGSAAFSNFTFTVES